ncbi:MAG: DNA replication/repair protein RecF [Gammaproteobacteria bacterium]|nr:DNA replication/repair protein RecF [Gammaproteobacteria bacterium]
MHLSRLEGKNLRRVRSFELRPVPGLNAIFGPNGSGKTTLLEAIYLLGVGRSFRSAQIGAVISAGEQGLSVFGRLERVGQDPLAIGVEKSVSHTRIRADGRDVKTSSEIAKRVPLLFVGPDSVRLLSDGGEARRRWLDWMVFHVEPNYPAVVQRYSRALRQRNALLKEPHQQESLGVWDAELIDAGESLETLRSKHFSSIEAVVGRQIAALVPQEVGVSYRSGWSKEMSLGEALRAARERDRGAGHTSVGPHRADVRFTVHGRGAKEILSRGESKLLVAALHLAQAAYCHELVGATPLVLVDELASELDEANRLKFVAELRERGSQIFVTAVERDLFPLGQASKVFHVEQGSVREML